MYWTLFWDALPKLVRMRGTAELSKVPDRTAYKSGVSERAVAIIESSGRKRLAVVQTWSAFFLPRLCRVRPRREQNSQAPAMGLRQDRSSCHLVAFRIEDHLGSWQFVTISIIRRVANVSIPQRDQWGIQMGLRVKSPLTNPI